MAPIHQLGLTDIAVFAALSWILYKTANSFRRRGTHTTPLSGPPRLHWLWGNTQYLRKSRDPGAVFEQWAEEYGVVYELPSVLGSKRVILCDPKALAHYFSRETYGYNRTPIGRFFIQNMFGRGLLWAEGDSHKRQRKILSPAFSNAAIRRLSPIFYDSAYKAKAAWDGILESSSTGDAIIEVQDWMNSISLDTIGIAGFSHDFGSLAGQKSVVKSVFESFGQRDESFVTAAVFLLGLVFPVMANLPIHRNRLMWQLKESIKDISLELLERTRKEKEGITGGARLVPEEKSMIGMLLKAENTETELHMSHEEIIAQMNVLLVAGYETTSISLTWALAELSRHLDIQQTLRDELSQFSATDPTWEQLSSGLPYLDAVVHETLRLHPALGEQTSVAMEDDVIPLCQPMRLHNGEVVDRITIAKGTTIEVSMGSTNRSVAFWGEDAKEFVPSRWLEGGEGIEKMRAKEIQGYRHLLTFVDGPRTCLGRGFALAEFKAVLSVLIRNYNFELPDGLETQFSHHQSILKRPKVESALAAEVPLRVRRVE